MRRSTAMSNADAEERLALLREKGHGQVGEKRKVCPEEEKTTLDKLAELGLDSDDEYFLETSVASDDLLAEDNDMELRMTGGGGTGGRGRGRRIEQRVSPGKFDRYDRVRGAVCDDYQGIGGAGTSRMSDSDLDMEQKQKESDVGDYRGSEKDEATMELAGERSDMVSELSDSNCQMKWLRTVGFDANSGKLRCTVGGAAPSSVIGSDTGQTESIMADAIQGLISVYMKKRSDIIDKDGIVATPLYAVKKLAKAHGETLHVESARFPNGYFRVELFSGSVRGLGEGMNKRIAAQMAAVDLLDRVRLSGGSIKIPPVGILPGWLTGNGVFRDLSVLCRNKDLQRPQYVVTANNEENKEAAADVPPYRAECWIGDDLVTVAESENALFAKREAAKQMFHTISDVEYRGTMYGIGQGCLSATQIADSGHKMIMSEYKKVWLLKYRVENKQIMFPEEEQGFDDPNAVSELENKIDELGEKASYKLMARPLKIRVNCKRQKLASTNDDEKHADMESKEERSVVVEELDDDSW